MDEQRFDRLARWAGARTSRRNLLRIAASGGFARIAPAGRAAAQTPTALNPPLPNFPFLPLLPTDPGFEAYQLDRLTGGGPQLVTDLTAPGFLTASLQQAVAAVFRGGYSATIVLPSKADPAKPDRAISTLVVDCGGTARAKQAYDAYAAALKALAGARELSGVKSIGKESTFLGCNGLCQTAVGDPYSGGANDDGAIAISYRGRLLTEVRVRAFTGDAVTADELRAAAKPVDVRVKAVESDPPTGISPFAAVTTTPVFSLNGEAPERGAQAFLRVRDGGAIPWAAPLDGSNATRRDEAARAGYRDLLHVEQTFATTAAYRDDYSLVTTHEQFFFPTAELRDAYFAAYRQQSAQNLPGITFSDIDVTDTRSTYVFTAPISDQLGTWSGFETFAKVDSPLGPAMYDVSLVAVPGDPATPPPPVAAVRDELGPALTEMRTAIEQCLLTPASCPPAVTIAANPTATTG